MNSESLRRIARTGLAPMVEDVPKGPEWNDLRHYAALAPTRSPRIVWLAGVASAVAVLVVVGVAAFIGDGEDLALPAIPLPTTSSEPQDELVLDEFDIQLFLESKLSGAFEDFHEQVGVVVVAPEEQQLALDSATVGLSELFGLTYVPVTDLAVAAARFADAHRMSPLEGSWVAYGLEPEFADSPYEEWVDVLTKIPGAVVAVVDFTLMDFEGLAQGWTEVARVPFSIPSGSLLQAVDGAIVIVHSASTIIIENSPNGSGVGGSWLQGPPPPFPFEDQCCGGASGYAVGEDLLVLSESSTATWLFDTSEFSWRELDERPSSGFVLGSAELDGNLIVVNAAPRSGSAESTVASLDLNDGSWQTLPSLPHPISVGEATSDGRRIIVAGTQQDSNNRIVGGPHVFELVGSNWQPIADAPGESDLPISGQAASVAWIENVGLLAWNYDLSWSILDESGTWGPVEKVPMDSAECYPTTTEALGGVVALCGGIAWFDGGSLDWTPIPYPSFTGERILVSESGLFALIESGRDTLVIAEYPLPPGGP